VQVAERAQTLLAELIAELAEATGGKRRTRQYGEDPARSKA
jgi:hypothetical protein